MFLSPNSKLFIFLTLRW